MRLKAVLAFYVLAAALLPLAHHDIVCHLKSSTHCTTCVVGSSGEASSDSAVLSRFWLNDVGAIITAPRVEPVSAVVRSATGRAPPAAA